MRYILVLLFSFLAVVFTHRPVDAESLGCTPGNSPNLGSGWCDFEAPVQLAKGTCLKLTLGGTAQKIVVRILQVGQDPSKAVGLIGKPVAVPSNKQIKLIFNKSYPQVVQISVHGREPWGRFIHDQNGPATLDSLEKIKCSS